MKGKEEHETDKSVEAHETAKAQMSIADAVSQGVKKGKDKH